MSQPPEGRQGTKRSATFSKKWLSRFFEVLQDLCEERLQSFALWVVEDVGRGALFDDRALGHEDDAVGDLAREAIYA